MTTGKKMIWFRGLLAISAILLLPALTFAQAQTIASSNTSRNPGRPMTIPLTIKLKEPLQEPELQNIDLTISEDGDPQTITSIRGAGTNSPITLAVLIQDDLVSSVSNEIKGLAEFIRTRPRGSRIMVGYLRTGSLQVKQKFTTDLEKAAKSAQSAGDNAWMLTSAALVLMMTGHPVRASKCRNNRWYAGLRAASTVCTRAE